jgi:hypothetical protein
MSEQQQWLQSWDAALTRWMHEQKRPSLESRRERQWERPATRKFTREEEQRPQLPPWARRVLAG